MRLSNFSVLVPQGTEKATDHVQIPHGTQYDICLGNHGNRRCDAEVSVDGKFVSSFRLAPGQTLTVEGPPRGDRGRFTAFAAETEDGRAAGSGGILNRDRGLVVVKFRPEYKIHLLSEAIRIASARSGTYGSRDMKNVSETADNLCRTKDYEEKSVGDIPQDAAPRGIRTCSFNNSSPSVQPAVTGLTGKTDQKWQQADEMDCDPSGEVVIAMRLVATAEVPSGIRPLSTKCGCSCGCATCRANAVPAPVGG